MREESRPVPIYSAAGLFVVAALVTANSFASEVGQTYCNDKAKRGEWKVGVKTQVSVKSIRDEFPAEFRDIVDFLDRLPIETSEGQILSGIPAKPAQAIRAYPQHVRFDWEIRGKASSLVVIVSHFKGCVSNIGLMDSRSNNYYSLHNSLASKP